MNEKEFLEKAADFGIETEQFLTSPIGKYLLDRSKQEVDAAVEKLKTVDPCEPRRIRELQNIIQRNEDVEQWLGEIIQAGREAISLLKEEL